MAGLLAVLMVHLTAALKGRKTDEKMASLWAHSMDGLRAAMTVDWWVGCSALHWVYQRVEWSAE